MTSTKQKEDRLLRMPPDGKTASVPTELIATELRAFAEKQELANRNKRNRIREQLAQLQARDKSVLEVLLVVISYSDKSTCLAKKILTASFRQLLQTRANNL